MNWTVLFHPGLRSAVRVLLLDGRPSTGGILADRGGWVANR